MSKPSFRRAPRRAPRRLRSGHAFGSPPAVRAASRAALLGGWLWAACLATAFALEPAGDPVRVLNTADAAALAATLPGVGPVKARAIVAYRERHGPFPDIDALRAVRGIGPVTLERIRTRLSDGAVPARAPHGNGAGAASGATLGAAAGTTRDPAGTREATAEPRAADAPRSTTERERAARAAVQALVARALADADTRAAR